MKLKIYQSIVGRVVTPSFVKRLSGVFMEIAKQNYVPIWVNMGDKWRIRTSEEPIYSRHYKCIQKQQTGMYCAITSGKIYKEDYL